MLVPVIVRVPAPACSRIPYIRPPPLNVLFEAELMEILEVPRLNVMFVEVVISQAVDPSPRIVHIELPSVSVLAELPDELNEKDVTLKLLVLKVPCVRVNVLVLPSVNALPRE